MISEKSKPKKSSALVTGAGGFIGSHLVSALLEQGWKVAALVRASTNRTWLDKLPITLIQGDYDDQASLGKAMAGIDYIFHLGAALRAVDRQAYFKANVKGTENLLRAACNQTHGLKKFVFVSSIAAAGPSKTRRFQDESQPCHPVSPYGESKLAAEKIVQSFKHHLPVTIMRPPNVLGPGQKELEIVLKLASRRILPMLGNGDLQTSICFVDDLVRALILAAVKKKSTNQLYYVTDNQAYSWRDMIFQIASFLGTDKLAVKIPSPVLYLIGSLSDTLSRLFHTPRLISRGEVTSLQNYYWLFSSEKIQKELGFVPRIHFQDGIRDVIEWNRDQGRLKSVKSV